MLGSPPRLPPPPLPPPPLPAFSMDEEQPQRGEDYDLLSGWARSLSVSPRLYPTYGHSNGMGLEHGNSSSTFGSYRGLGDASPMLSSRKEPLSVGTGLSPLLGPTHLGGGGGGGHGGSSGGGTMLMASGQGGYDYPAFGQYHTSPLDTVHHNPSPLSSHPLSHRHASQSSSSHSFSNVDSALRSMSPQALPPPLHQQRHSPPLASTSHSTTTSFVPASLPTTPNPQEPSALSASLMARATSTTSDDLAQEDPRIRAYAKLEFPTLDIYIQKLSVIVGRRPAAPVVPLPPPPPAPRMSEEEGVKLEDFVMGMLGDDDKKRVEEVKLEPTETAIPVVALTASSRPGSPARGPTPLVAPATAAASAEANANAGIEFSDFLKSSPTLGATELPVIKVEPVALPPPIATSPLPPPPPTAAPPLPLPPLPPSAPPVPQELAPVVPPPILTDIDLGPIRAVSRQHARLYFDYEMGGWTLEVLGRNGVVVEGKWKAKGEKESLGRRTKIQIAERIFYFVLPTIEPIEPTTLAPLQEAPMSDSDSSLSSAESDESSSLSELSSSDCELSPVIPPTYLLRSPPAIKVTDAWSPPRASTSNLLLALAPPPRAASKGVTYTEILPYTEGAVGATAGKRLEVLQAVRNGGKGGKGGGGKGGGGKGKGAGVRKKPAAKKGKTTLPQKKVRRQSNASREDWDDDEDEEQDYSDEDMDDYYFDRGEVSPPKRAPEPVYKKKREEVVKKVVQAVKQPVARKQPKKQPARVVHPTPPNLPPAILAASPSITLGSLPPLPDSNVSAGPSFDPAPRPLYGSTDPSPFIPSQADIQVSNLPPLPSLSPNPIASGSSSSLATPGAALAASSLPPLPGQAFVPGQPGVPGVPGVPIKRGRGRPPKNGICAQRPRKPKPEPLPGQPTPPVVKKTPKPKVPKPKPVPRPPPPAPVLPPSPPPVITHDGIPLDPSLPAATPTQPASPYPTFPEPPSAFNPVGAPAAPGANPAAVAPGAPPPTGEDLLVKPPYTYASLIAQAVSSVETRKLTLNGIYDWITARWPYFSDNNNGWQNSIRHNLTISRGFLKIPRRTDEPGKGAFWAIDPTQIRNFDGLHFRKKTPKGVPGAPKPPKPVPQPKPGPSLVPKAKLVTQRSNVAGPSKPVPRPGPPASTAPSLSTPLPIIIAPIPDSYVRPAPPPSATPPDDLTASLLKDPPIVLHEGKLILNPVIFAHLQKTQLDNLQVLPASQALQILQAFVVQHFKDKMRKMAVEKEKAAAAAAANGGGAGTSGTPGPAAGTSNGPSTTTSAAPRAPLAASSGATSATPAGAAAGTPSTVASTPAPAATPAAVASVAPKTPSVPTPIASTPTPTAGAAALKANAPAVAVVAVAPKPVAAAPALANGAASSGIGKRKLEGEEDIEVSAPKMARLEGGTTVA